MQKPRVSSPALPTSNPQGAHPTQIDTTPKKAIEQSSMTTQEFATTINSIITLTQKGYINWCATCNPDEYMITIGNATISINHTKVEENETYTLKILNLSGDVLKSKANDLETEGDQIISQLYTAARESYLKCDEILSNIRDIVKEMKEKYLSNPPSSQPKSNSSQQ